MSHAHNTSIAKSRLGPPRFGRRGDSDGAGPVVTYRLSEEERLALVEKYGPPMDPERAERIRMKYRTLATGAGRAARGEENEEGGENGMPPKLDITKEQIESALRVTQGNVKKAIKILQISVGAFYKYVREFGIDVASFRAPEAEAAHKVPEDGAGTEPVETATAVEEPAAAGEIIAPATFAQVTPVEDPFADWLKVERKNFVGQKEKMITVDKRGTVRLLSCVGSNFQPGDRVEFFLSPDKRQLAVRKVNSASGFKLRADSKSPAKMCNCAELRSLLQGAGIELPARFEAEWDEHLQAWVGRR